MDRGGNSDAAPSCSVSGGGSARDNRSREGDENGALGPLGGDAQVQTQQQQQQEHNIFGDSNLNMVMMFMLMLHFMQYAMRPPCGC
ncbi:hypothetical protein Gpo141_00000849 [Globisporangium polare]